MQSTDRDPRAQTAEHRAQNSNPVHTAQSRVSKHRARSLSTEPKTQGINQPNQNPEYTALSTETRTQSTEPVDKITEDRSQSQSPELEPEH